MDQEYMGVAGGQGRTAGDVVFASVVFWLPFVVAALILSMTLHGCIRNLAH